MHRTLFDQYEIEDQNHDFLISKAYFTEALKEHIVSEFFKTKNQQGFKIQTVDSITYNQYTSDEEDTYYNMLLLRTHEEFINHREVMSEVELLYFPNIAMTTKNPDISLYHISLINSKIEFDLDKIFLSVRKRLKQKRIDHKVTLVYDTKKMMRQIINFNDIGKMEILIQNKDTFDVIWEIISVLENDFFRSVEISDLKM